MSFALSQKSLDRLVGVHPDLVDVVKRAIEISDVDFVVTEGVRSLAKQEQLLKSGASQTMKSRHLTGHAVDLAPIIAGQVRWDWPPFHKIADAMKAAAKELDIKIVCGADWKSFPDGPHHELDRKFYP